MSETTILDERSPLMLFDVFGGLRTLWHHRLLIAVAILAMLTLGGLYIVLTKPIYTASAAILVDPRDARATNLDSVLPGIGADSAAISSQVSVIQSRDLLGAVFDAQGLATDPEFADPGLTAKLLSLVKPVRQLSRDEVFDKFQSLVSVDREGLTYIIDVSFKSHDADKAARIVNAIVDRYKQSLAGETANANSSVSNALSDKIGGLQGAVSDAERAVEDFKTQHHIFDATTGGSLQSQIDQLTTQLVAAQDQANQAQDKYAQAVAAGTSPQGLDKLSAIVSSSATDKLRDDYNERAAALANAQAIFGPKHPTIVSLEAELSKLEGLMAREADRIIQQLKADRDLAAQNVAKLKTTLATLRAEGSQSDLAQVQLRGLQRNADAARSVLDDFMKRAQETSQMQGLQISQIRIISSAAPPTQATWPKPLLLLPVSAFLGLAAGCVLALALGVPQAKPLPAPLPVDPRPTNKTQPQPVPPQVRRSRIPGLGTYSLPTSPSSPLRNRLKAARQEIAMADDTPFARSVQGLIAEVLNRLGRRGKPYVLLLSSVSDGVERSIAADLIGMGLQRIGGRVLRIETANPAAGPAPLRSSAGTAFTDPTSGLDTIMVPVDPRSAATLSVDDVAEIAVDAGVACDFILVIGAPVGDPAYNEALAADSNLELVVLNADEAGSRRSQWLDAQLAGGDTRNRATMVVDTGVVTPGSEALRPRLVVSNGRDRRVPASARG